MFVQICITIHVFVAQICLESSRKKNAERQKGAASCSYCVSARRPVMGEGDDVRGGVIKTSGQILRAMICCFLCHQCALMCTLQVCVCVVVEKELTAMAWSRSSCDTSAILKEKRKHSVREWCKQPQVEPFVDSTSRSTHGDKRPSVPAALVQQLFTFRQLPSDWG